MYTHARDLMLVAAVCFAAITCISSHQDDREFGWSLKVESAGAKKVGSKRSQPAAQSSDPDEIRVDTDLVLSDLLVQDKNGVPIQGLRAADFEISEGGLRQTIDVFAYGDSSVPRSIILVIDHSLSQRRHIDRSIGAAKILVDSMRPNDRMAIVSDDVKLVVDLTADKDVLKSALEELRVKCGNGAFGKSRQYSALFAALNEKVTRNGTRNIVIFQSDGDEYSLLRENRSLGLARFGIDEIVSAAERRGVTIHTVYTGLRLGGRSKREIVERTRDELTDQMRTLASVGNPAARSVNEVRVSDSYLEAKADRVLAEELAVAKVAQSTGGIAQSLETPDQAQSVYNRILSDIDHRYLIGYYPAGRSDGNLREREVRITLRNKKNLRLVGGRTYVSY